MFKGLGEDYFGPPAPGQSYEQFQSQSGMSNETRVAITLAAGAAGSIVGTPLVGLAAAAGAWLLGPSLARKSKPKPPVQGG